MILNLSFDEALRLRFALILDTEWRTNSAHAEMYHREVDMNEELLCRIEDILDAAPFADTE